MLPFSEVVWKIVVGLLRHNVFFHLVVVLDLFEDGARIEIGDADDHSCLYSVEIKGAEFLVHGGNDYSIFILESESDVGGF